MKIDLLKQQSKCLFITKSIIFYLINYRLGNILLFKKKKKTTFTNTSTQHSLKTAILNSEKQYN
jgi:hypothetical protein